MHTYIGASGSTLPRLRYFSNTGARAAPTNYPVIATANLRLRPFRQSDLARLVEIANQHHVVDASMDVPVPFTPQDARRWIESHTAGWATTQALHWAISLLADDRLIGYTGLHDIDLEERQAELRFWIGRGAERKGYALEATQATLAFAFATLQVDRIYAFHLAKNVLGARVLAKIGMTHEAVWRQRIRKRDLVKDIIITAISRSNWLDSL